MDSLNQKGRRAARGGSACWAGPLERVLGRHRERERGELAVGVWGRLGCGERAREKSGIGEGDDGLPSGLDWVQLGFGLGFLVLVFLSNSNSNSNKSI